MHFKIENRKPDTWFPQLSYSSLLASGGEFNKFYGSPQFCFVLSYVNVLVIGG